MRFRNIVFCVSVLHLIFFFFSPAKKQPLKAKKISIKELSMPVVPERKKPIQQKKIVKKVKKKPKPKKKKVAQGKAIDDLQKCLDSLDLENTFQPSKDLCIPNGKIAIEAPPLMFQEETEKTLIRFLRNQLKLPEYGAVKVSLTINFSGKVSSLEIISSKSEKNSAYLKNRLPQLDFPCFNDLNSEETKTFTFLFQNENF